MVPSIYPLETLHNSLSLKQVDEFITAVCETGGDAHSRTTRALSAMFDSQNQPSVDSYMPQRVLSSSVSPRQRSDRPPWYSSGPSSTVSSAGPSSPTTADASPHFSFSDKTPFTPQEIEEIHSCHHNTGQQAPTAGPQTPKLSNPTSPTEDPTTPCQTPPEDNPEAPASHLPLSGNSETRQEEPGESPASTEATCGEVPDLSPLSPSSPLADLSLGRMDEYLPGSLPVLLELRESGSEAGSSAQTPQSPEGPDEFFDTQETVEMWRGSTGSLPHSGMPLEVGAPHASEP
eukprot:XP_014031912.1 PREDICTED: inositol hexakisphosphate and diphosphoinositol-pentakisphosphate kinase 1-like [Salmo salar]